MFIGLTVFAVLFKTDTFKKDDGHHHGHNVKHSEPKEEHHHEETKHVPQTEQGTVENRQPEEVLSAREAPAAVEDPVPTTSKQEWEKQASESADTKVRSSALFFSFQLF